MGLFGRQVFLSFGLAGFEGREFRDIRIRFRVDQKRTSDPHKAVIEAWNLTRESAAILQDPKVVVRLSAGYETPRQIFVGEPIKNGVAIRRQGTERLARIEALDGGKAYQESRVNVTMSTGSTIEQILEEVIGSFGLPTGTIEIPENNLSYPDGVHLGGTSRDVMDRLMESLGAQWFINDGVINVVGTDAPVNVTGPLFSVAGGNLIGSPTPKDEGTIEIKALLDPDVRPGTPFRVESEQYSGDYTARDVIFTGDSGWDTPFYVTIIGTRRSA